MNRPTIAGCFLNLSKSLIVVGTLTGYPVQANPDLTSQQGDPIAHYLEVFSGLCHRLDSLPKKGIHAMIELQQAGYFAHFCRTIAFEHCSDFNDELKPYGFLLPKGDGRCRYVPSPASENIVGF